MISDILSQGFWGMGLSFFVLPLSLIGNGIYSIFVLIFDEKRNVSRTLLIGTIIVSIICSSVGLMIANRTWEPLNVFYMIGTVLWLWYFILVPQMLIRLIISKIKKTESAGLRLRRAILRLVLTALLPHWLLRSWHYSGLEAKTL
jgi:hypothetical protein